MIQTDKNEPQWKAFRLTARNDRRSLRYRQSAILECDWSRTKMTLRDARRIQ